MSRFKIEYLVPVCFMCCPLKGKDGYYNYICLLVSTYNIKNTASQFSIFT